MKDKVKKIVFLVAIILIIVVSIIAFINYFNNDGMKRTKGISIYYKTYTDEDGWSKWSKNGVTSGDQVHKIKNIEVKIKSKDKGKVLYKAYINDKWGNDLYNVLPKNNNINGVEIMATDIINRKYNICYRTYNKKDKWFEWSCDGDMNGNSQENITALEVKMVIKGAPLEDYLKDYYENEIKSKGFTK